MKKLIRSFGYAFKGIGYATATQLNFRIHLVATVLAVGLVLILELVNTAVEALTDLASPGYHELAGRAKDVCAAAVVIAAAFAVITGLIIFLPKLLLLFPHAA
jgi:diacylglycerol kinase (ATP)